MKTKLEREWQALKPNYDARKKVEEIKENKDLDKYYDELLKEAERE
ncbi:MAG: hypothetical protein ACJA0T_001948 [Colwellia sp.]